MNPTQYGKVATTEEEKAQNRANLQAGLAKLGTSSSQVNGNVIPNTPIDTSINSNNLSNITPVNLSDPKIGTASTGLSAEITSGSNSVIQGLDKQDALAQQLQADKATKEKSLKKSSSFLSSLLGSSKSESQLTDEAYSQTNDQGTTVDETGKKLRSLNARINAIDIATNEQIKTAQAQKGGTVSGTNDAIRAIERNAATSKADLYIEKLLAQGDYDSAKSIADRKVAVIMEQEKLDYEKAKFDYENNKDLFTKAEQREFELALGDRTRALDKQENDLKSIESLAIDALENGATPAIASQMRNAKTVDEAIRIGGQYVNAIARNEARVKLLLDEKKLLAEDTTVTSDPLVNAMINVNAGSAEGQQKRDAERIAQFVKNGQTDQAKSLLLSRVTSKMSATEREGELDRRNTIDALTDMRSALNDYVATTGDTGILKGGIENIANKIGTTSDPALAGIKTRIVQATQKYRNSITGAAWGDQETAEYKAIFPSISNTNKLNSTIIDTMIPLLQNNERNAIGLFLGGADVYDGIFGSPTSANEEQELINAGYTPAQIKQLREAK